MAALAALAGHALSVLALVLTPLLVLDADDLRAFTAEVLGAGLGRTVEIGGLALARDDGMRVSLRDLRVANAAWGEHDALARIARIDLLWDTRAAWPARRLVVDEIRIENPRLWLERTADGRRNWPSLGGGGEANAPVQITTITLKAGRVVVRDVPTRTRATFDRLDLDAAVPADAAPSLVLDGRLGAAPVHVEARGGARRQATIRLGDARIDITGGDALSARFEAPTLAAFPAALGLPLPDTPPVTLEGDLKRRAEGLAITGLGGAIGESAFTGELDWRRGAVRPRLTGRLDFEPLRAVDIAGVVGAGPDDPALIRGRGPLPEVRFDARQLYSFDADLRLSARAVVLPRAPVTGVDGRLRIDAGLLRLEPLRLDIAAGRARGALTLDGRERPPRAALRLDLAELRLAPFFRGSRFVEEMGGRFGGAVDLTGTGASVDALLAAADGRVRLRMDGGSLSGLAVEALGLDLIEALALRIGPDTRVPIHCAEARLDVRAGTGHLERAVVDTRDSVIRAAGRVDLARERFDLELRADAKDPSLVDATAPIRVRGSFLSPDVTVGALEGLPFFETGDAPAVDCGHAVGE